MHNLAHLLAEAAELAPEWCAVYKTDTGFRFDIGSRFAVMRDSDEAPALILWEVLKDAHSRGWYYQILRAMFDADTRDDPAEASLSAFVSLLRLSREEVG